VVRRWGTPFREGGGPCTGVGYQSGDWWWAEVAGQAVSVTAARDEPWRHLAHGGRQAEKVSVTCSAPPSHRPSRPSRWCPGSTGSCNRVAHLSAYPASPSARLMMTGRGCSRARAGGKMGLGGRDLESRCFSTCVRTLCVVTTQQAFFYIILQHNTETSCQLQASHPYSRCRAARALSLSLRSTVMFLYFLLHRITYVCKYVERMTRHSLHINLYIIALPVI